MIEPETCKAIYWMHQQGMGIRIISRQLQLSRNTVRRMIQHKGSPCRSSRADKAPIDEALLRRLYAECQGRVQRVHEKLVEEEGVPITYPSLTRRLREFGISNPPTQRCAHVEDQPGLEMQHDTTVYTIELGERPTKVVASLLYLRYSKRRYLKFYRRFNRFRMKCFLHEALMHWGHAAKLCIIDNTNLARWRGSGADAILVPEMEMFSAAHRFAFQCHALGHPNRKAGNERSFWTVETNFLPGRTFSSLEDLNRQAFEWATVRMENRPQTKSNLIPAVVFEHERIHMQPLSAHLPAPYLAHTRSIDEYGDVALGANYYWAPGSQRGEVRVVEYAERIEIYRAYQMMAEYPLPAEGTKNQRFSPPGQPTPRHQPRHRKKSAQEEEKRLREMGPAVNGYVDFLLQCQGIQRHELLRKLLALSQRMTPSLFARSLQRAHRYQITSLAVIERMAALCAQEGDHPLPIVEVHALFRQREAYREGALTNTPDLTVYDSPTEEPDHEG